VETEYRFFNIYNRKKDKKGGAGKNNWGTFRDDDKNYDQDEEKQPGL
jgi:hypothetical protein